MKGFNIIVPDHIFGTLKKIPKDRQRQIISKIDLISKSPETLDIIKMKGREDTYRLRVGDYRVIFVVDFIDRTINIDRIGSRQEMENYY